MAEIYCGIMSDGEAGSAGCDLRPSRAARRRRVDIRRCKLASGVNLPDPKAEEMTQEQERKRRYQNFGSTSTASYSRRSHEDPLAGAGNAFLIKDHGEISGGSSNLGLESSLPAAGETELSPRYGIASVCGRRRDMEDAVSVHPSFSRELPEFPNPAWHYFGVYDGHGCSHVATRCRERLHELVKEELVEDASEWKGAMERSFTRMDREVVVHNESLLRANCKCELRPPDCNAVGSTAVVAVVTPDAIIVANCGDSRAVLCRNGKPIALSSDHKPDRPDELGRIEAAGGRVIFWNGPRVLGVLAMSRAIGDNYLKPYVSCEPEVTVVERTEGDECLILASDGLWDVVSNETACSVARMCLRGGRRKNGGDTLPQSEEEAEDGEGLDKACTDASLLLTKLALARNSSDNVSVVVVDLKRSA